MAAITITDLGNDIQVQITGTTIPAVTKYTFNKISMRVKQTNTLVYITNSDSFIQGKDNKVVELDYSEVTSPSYADNDALYAGLISMMGTTSLGGSSSGGGGGNNTWSTKSGDFIATPTVSTKTITVTGLPWTLEAGNVSLIEKYDSSGNKETLDISPISVSGGVITLSDEDNFASGDSVEVTLIGPDKAYDKATDSQLSFRINPEYEHYTSVEHLVSEADLGITATADGTDTDTLTDADGGFSVASVAVGFEAYSEEEDTAATVLSVDSATAITTDAITDWTGDTYWLPECKRFVIPTEGFNHMTIHARLSTDDVNNVAYCKIYGTLDADADDTDDTYWVDLSTDIFGGATLSATNDTTEGLYFVDTSRPMLKYMIKIVAEVIDGGAAAAAANDFDIYIKKSS